MTRLVILCVTWMVLSAATAYYADIWGRKLGKQRKTLFGWRPKKTAVFIITSSGAFIALCSFLILLTANAGIRNALTKWDETVRLNDALRKEQAQLIEQRDTLNQQIPPLQDRYKAAKTAYDKSQGQLAEIRNRYEAARKNLKLKTDRLNAIEARLTDVNTRLSGTNGQLRLTSERLRDTVGQLSSAQDKLVDLRRQNTDQQRKLDMAVALRGKAEEDLKKARTNVDAALQRELSIRRGDLIATSNEELIRTVVPPRKALWQAREGVVRALNKAREEIYRRTMDAYEHDTSPDAKPPAGPSVQILKKVIPVKKNGKVVPYSVPDQQIIDTVAEQLMSPTSPSPGGVVLQVVSMANAVAGEPVTVDFQLYENHVVFQKNDVIASVVVRRSETGEEIANDIQNALQQTRETALKNGLMKTEGEYVGSIPAFQLMDVYSEVRHQLWLEKDRVELNIVAAQDTWTSDPLKLTFRVEGFKGEA